MREKYSEMFIELGFVFVSDCANLETEDFAGFLLDKKDLPKAAIERLDFLAEVVYCLQEALGKGGAIKEWLCMQRKRLLNLSPAEWFRRPNWKPDDIMSRHIFKLAERIASINSA